MLVVVIGRNAHNLPMELAEDSALFRFCVDVGPHSVGGAVFQDDLALADFILDVKIHKCV